MDEETSENWTTLSPPFSDKAGSGECFASFAKQLARFPESEDECPKRAEGLRQALMESAGSLVREDRQVLLAAVHVLTDLAAQGWEIRHWRGEVQTRPSRTSEIDGGNEKARLRRQELVQRDAQLREPSVRTFVQSMERSRVFEGRFVSIYSLFRDGRDLAERLRGVREGGLDVSDPLKEVVDPYLQLVSGETRCSHTGLKLMEIWRYFRHTWSTPHRSTPGRRMMFLVRDRAAPYHPVIGIGAISSPVVQLSERDRWIGWDLVSFLETISAKPTTAIAKWLERILSAAIDEIYLDDFLKDGTVTRASLRRPDQKTITCLLREGQQQRELHHRYSRSKDHKQTWRGVSSEVHWGSRARTHLFRSKRALALAGYLQAWSVLNEEFGGRPTRRKLAKLLSTRAGRDAIRRVLKKAKADRVGVGVADLSVCGAVPPYGPVLGGKLVAMLAASPEVVGAYRRRYGDAESEIASSMAGRPIVRRADLVLLCTSSLYGTGSSQYNRIRIPGEQVGDASGKEIRYYKLGYSEAFGTSQYSAQTVDALARLVEQTNDGQRVNSVFGEGVSPRLRKVRGGLDSLNFPSAVLLRHFRRRIVYGVPLALNFRDCLLGLAVRPDYILPMKSALETTAAIASWWRKRWLSRRIRADSVLEDAARHSLVRPIRHGARVDLPYLADEYPLFPDSPLS